ncbi:hypothetical protein [Streptomyces alboflavus]|uniref:hypothetical protein n=1 Tax=Streptomyces alboflavus TaxID=67267 RepID=UPI0036843EDA
MLAVDAQGFTELPAVQHASVSRLIPALVDEALTASGLNELKGAKAFPANTGDGVVFGFPPSRLPFVVWPFLDVLNGVLGAYNTRCAEPRIRLRAALHVGPLPDTGTTGDGNGTPRNDTHRLLDSRPARDFLSRACAETTHLVSILSHRVYEDVVLAGYTGLHPRRCVDVTATVTGKNFTQLAWLYIPSPSGELLKPGPPHHGTGDRHPARRAARPGRQQGVAQRVGTGIAFAGDVGRDFHYGATVRPAGAGDDQE